MSDPPLSTMAPPAAADQSRTNPQARTASSNPPPSSASKNSVTREYDLVLRAIFPTPAAPAKFNPILAMKNLFRTLLKDEPSLVLCTASNDEQIVLSSAPIPTGETAFKKFFKVSTTRIEKQNSTNVCIGCYVLSDRSLSHIKFKSPENNLLTWLKKERIFLDSDSLGIERPTTIGYFTQIAPDITHLANFREYLVNQLMLVDIAADDAIALAPYLKASQLEAMSSGDEFVTILPNFEVYRTRLSHGRTPTQVTTDVIGIKCEPRDAKLLKEFFTRLASETGSYHRDGMFVPAGAASLLGPQTYEQVLKDNNLFLSNVATIPINLEYAAWFAVIDSQASSDTATISLHDHLLRKPWYLRIESAGRKKCLLVTTRPNLQAARDWIDENLEPMVRQSIPDGIIPLSEFLPRRLDKPTYTTASQSYADILKKQFSIASATSATTTDITRPPRKRQATKLDYDSDSPTDQFPPLATVPSPSYPPTATLPQPDYAAELIAIKKELSELRNFITSAVAELKNVIISLPTQGHPSTNETETLTLSNMETEVEPPTATTSDLSDLIAGLKHDIATKLDISDLIVDLKSDIALIKSHPLFCNLKPINQHIPVT